ncbi:ABC transporter permease [Bifidobacterium rousetti]|uniref:ABC transporter permease n=1 Tax=Bifidobacterium rousetti TaxID=2045439 RepID=UPI001239170E|nr:ABC transporter permease [Bifidobacterium rousetti]KAA8819491.1 ABC transporter permease [Bifidobacterium rousetti]
MNEIAAIVRLRWLLTLSALRRSVLQTVGFALALTMGVGAVVVMIVLAVLLGMPRPASHAYFLLGLNSVIVMIGSIGMLFAIVIQLMLIGEGSAMTPQRFELYGIGDSRLQWALLAAGLSGPVSIIAAAALVALAFIYRQLGWIVVLVGIVSALFVVITTVCCAKMVLSLVTTLVTTVRGKTLFYLVVIVLFIAPLQLSSLLPTGAVAADDVPASNPLDTGDIPYAGSARLLSFTPFGAAFRLPFDVATGAWAPLLIHLAILAATWTICFRVSTWCLGRQRLTRGADTSSKVKAGLGDFSHMPDSVSGAVSARLFTYLKRDPRQAMLFVMPIILVAACLVQSRAMGGSFMAWQSLTWLGVFMMMVEGNGIAYDGTGFAMEVICGVRGGDDRLGRVRVLAAFAVIYLFVLAVLLFAITGDWRTQAGIAMGLGCLAVGIGVAFASLGLAEIVSTVLLYPAPDIDRPFSSPQGRAVAQGVFPFVHMFGTVLVMLPAGIVALVTLVMHTFGAPGATMAIAVAALVNGTGALALGTWLGGKLLDARAVGILGTLDEFASLQK